MQMIQIILDTRTVCVVLFRCKFTFCTTSYVYLVLYSTRTVCTRTYHKYQTPNLK